jgi:hypothetical protein
LADHHTLDERMTMVESKLLIIEATKGTLRLCTAHVALLWTVMLSLVGVAVLVLHTEWATAQNTAALLNLSARVESHVMAPGHAISLERLLQMQTTLNEVKALVMAHMERIQSR